MAVLNPLKQTQHELMQDTDLAGPLVFCLAFGGSLMLVSTWENNYCRKIVGGKYKIPASYPCADTMLHSIICHVNTLKVIKLYLFYILIKSIDIKIILFHDLIMLHS
jgi:hypothetical protein